MRNLSLVSICALLLATVACGSSSSDSNDPGGGEIRSEEDVRQFFQAIMPDLVAALTQLANDPSFMPSAFSASADKGGSSGSTVQCPDGGSLTVDPNTGQATVTDCAVRGITFSAQLQLYVTGTPPFYSASFNGVLMVRGSFTGTVDVNYALISWTDPATDANTYWEVTVTVNDLVYIVTSGDSGNGDSGDCSSCLGMNTQPPGVTPDPAVSCGAAVDFQCTCMTESGSTAFFYLSGVGCIF